MSEDHTVYKILRGNEEDLFAVSAPPKRTSQTGFFLCTEGNCQVSLDDVCYTLKKNDIFIYFPFSTLKILYRSDDLYGIVMALDIETIQPMLTKIVDVDFILFIHQSPVAVLTEENTDKINSYISLYQKHLQLSKLYADNDRRRFWQLNNLQLNNIKNNLILQILMAYTTDESNVKNIANRKDEIVRSFLHSLAIHYLNEHEVNFYASQQYITMRYFSSVVKEKTGLTPSQWITNYLMKEAKEMLTNSTLTVKEIAEHISFPNQSYFGKWFKSHMGIGPTEYKRMENEL